MAKKHFENIIGKIIYGTLLFMPLMAVGITCAYVVCNKNAYQSYSGSYQYLTTVKYNTYITNKALPFTAYTEGNDTNYKISSTSFNNIDIEITKSGNQRGQGIYAFNANSLIVNGTEYNDITSFTVGFVGTSYVIVRQYDININENYFVKKISEFTYDLQYSGTQVQPIRSLQVLTNSTDFSLKADLSSNTIYTDKNTINTNSVLTYSDLDLYMNDTTLSSVFYASINKVEQSPLFNWTTETAINDVIHQTTTTLGINNSFVDLLLTYWLLMTIIYVIYDLGLMLIQIAHKKVHKICDKD